VTGLDATIWLGIEADHQLHRERQATSLMFHCSVQGRVADFSDSLGPECAARDGDRVPRRVLRIGERVPVALVYRTERKPLPRRPGAECFDIRYIEHELDDGLTALATAAQWVKHDVGPGRSGAFQLDDAIARRPVDSEPEMACVEPGDDLHVVDVEQNSAEDGRRWVCRVPLGHWLGFGEDRLQVSGVD